MFTPMIRTNCIKCGKEFDHDEFHNGELITTCLECKYPPVTSSKSNAQEIIIKHQELDVTDEGLTVKSTPKPTRLSEYVGQTNNKEAINTALQIIRQVKPINIFINGFPGCGKSALAEIIAKELDANYIYTIPEQLKNMSKIQEVLNEIQTTKQLTVWMIDEIHNIDKKLINILLPVLQDHRLGNTTIRQFVLIGATTDHNKLYQKSEALLSRFQTQIKLERYADDEIVTILKQYVEKLDMNVDISDEHYKIIARNCKGIPREAINTLLKRLVGSDMNQILKENKIIKDGLNETDIKLLKCLAESKKPMGANFLSQRADMIEKDYLLVYEPFLIKLHLIDRTTRGREISEKGRNLLKCLTEKKNC